MNNLKSLGLTLGATAVVLSMNAVQADACGVGDVDFQVTALSLNVRAGAGTEYPVIGSVKKGQVVRPFESEQNGAWGKIKLSNGKTGWVSMQYMKSLDTCNSEESSKEDFSIENWDGVVTASALNVRSNASMTSSVITKLARNTEVTVLSQKGGFYCVEYKNYGKFATGYVSKDYISKKGISSNNTASVVENTTVNVTIKRVVTPGCKNLNIRISPSTGSTVVAKASYDSKVEVSERNGDWVKVKGIDAQGKSFQGWAHSNYIR